MRDEGAMSHPFIPRILLIDDTPTVHEDFKKILCKSQESTGALDDAMAALLGGEALPAANGAAPATTYRVDSAFQGAEGLKHIQKSIEAGDPYALAFVDIRMPPGWDGIKTIEEIWKVDAHVQTVICTAYSDYSWDQTIQRLGVSDRLLILKKPFDGVEISQLASSLTHKWRTARNERELVEKLKKAESEARAYASSLETVNRALTTAKAAADKVIELRTHFLSHLRDEVTNGVSEILKDTAALRGPQTNDAESMECLNIITSVGNQLISTFQETMEIAMLESSRLQCIVAPVGVKALVTECAGRFEAAARDRGLEFKIQIDPGTPEFIDTDGARIRQILDELLDNAVRFTTKGTVCIAARAEQTDHWQRPIIYFIVSDTGCGISESLRGTLFEPFGTKVAGAPAANDRPRLGLALSKKLAQVLGGDLTVDSTPGKGSTFTLAFETTCGMSV